MSGDDKRRAILESARALFLRFGKRKTSVDQIARTAGIGKGTIYSYFPSKDEIWGELLQSEADKLITAIEGAVDKARSYRDKLTAYALTRFNYIQRELDVLNLDERILEEFYPEVEEFREMFLGCEQKLIARLLNEGVAAGEFRPVDTELLAFTIIAVMRGLEIPWIWQRQLVSVEERMHTLLDVFYNGLLA